MSEWTLQLISACVCAVLFCIMTFKTLGVMQQCGYKNGAFWTWFTKKENMFFNRICVVAYSIAMSVCVVSLCFSFLGERWALTLSAIPFFVFVSAYIYSDKKRALKVPFKKTGRAVRLFVVYLVFVAAFSFGVLALLGWLRNVNGSPLYRVIGYVPFAFVIVCLPFILIFANALTSIFENARNKKYVTRVGQVLNQTDIIRVGVVGSYGKTSVKNILKTLLQEKYTVVETPASYNTPIGIAKTVFSQEFTDKQVFIAEMGARRKGDIKALCALVKPNFAVFTGVCRQHLATFGSIDNVWEEKSEIIKSGALTVCADSLRPRIAGEENVRYTDGVVIEDIKLLATETKFTWVKRTEKTQISIPLLGETAVENVRLCMALALQMGLTEEEIENGLQKIQPIPHRLQLIESGGAYILDDGYNANERGAKEAVETLSRFTGRKCIVTPGIVECGILESEINEKLGEQIAQAGLDKVILVGETLVCAVKNGYVNAGGTLENLKIVKTLDDAQKCLKDWLAQGDAVLFLNDLPDVY